MMPSINSITTHFSNLFSNKQHESAIPVDNSGVTNPILRGDNTNKTLINVHVLGIGQKHVEMFTTVNKAVIDYMASPNYKDPYGYAHIQRIVALIHKIYQAHKDDAWVRDVDPIVIFLAGLVHKVGGPQSLRAVDDFRDHEDIMRDFLKQHECIDPRIYAATAFVASHVSLARELNEPEEMKDEAEAYVALRIVQDAVRLDGLGAIGLARCFEAGEEINFNIFQKSLELMKTEKGRKLAFEQVQFMERFRKHWAEETDCSSVL